MAKLHITYIECWGCLVAAFPGEQILWICIELSATWRVEHAHLNALCRSKLSFSPLGTEAILKLLYGHDHTCLPVRPTVLSLSQ